MFEICLIILYTALFSAYIKRSTHFVDTGLSQQTIVSIFVVKVVVGVLYGVLYKLHYWGGDTYVFFNNGEIVYNTFWDHPLYYLKNMVGIYVEPPNRDVFPYPSRYYFWRDMGIYHMVHVQAILRIFSFGYYNLHVVFMALLGTLAGLNIFKIFYALDGQQKRLLALGVFFVPSLLFWTSGIHKDGFIYLGVSFIMLGIYRIIVSNLIKKGLLWLFLGLFIVLLFRAFLIVILLPAIVAVVASLKYKEIKPWKFFVGSYLMFMALFLLIGLALPKVDLIAEITKKYLYFQSGVNPADTSISLYNVITAIPSALTNAILRPRLSECDYILQYIAAIEIFVFLFLALLAALFPSNKKMNPFDWFMLCFAIANFLMIGFMVDNAGAISRYRCIALSFSVLLVLRFTNYRKIASIISRWRRGPRLR